MKSYRFHGRYWHPAIQRAHWIRIVAQNYERAVELLEQSGSSDYVYTLEAIEPSYV